MKKNLLIKTMLAAAGIYLSGCGGSSHSEPVAQETAPKMSTTGVVVQEPAVPETMMTVLPTVVVTAPRLKEGE